MSVRKRSGSGGRKALKEKVVEVYEGLFRGDQIAVGNSNYWEEFFLLKPKISVLEVSIIFIASCPTSTSDPNYTLPK